MKKSSFKSSVLSLILTSLTILGCEKELATKEGIVSDIDGNIYNAIRIGSQVWMDENLKTTRYNNGQTIGTTTPATKDIIDESMPKYQWPYDGDENNVATYGRLYTWYAATDKRNICPAGWHVPTNEEWEILIKFLGGENTAGAKLKESGTGHWASPNTGATNESGFTALPGGLRVRYNYNGEFHALGAWGLWWSSTPESEYWNSAYNRYLETDTIRVYSNRYNNKNNGNSVRCIKD